ncbi:MAG: Beta-galactosidase trimerization domain protein [Lentisphaerae bacterium ADurb.BinA184]|nr:MAG: Beta-galactosidase trimerization domain protein [Lentisphaerae bacterium ADurb.BinA184]
MRNALIQSGFGWLMGAGLLLGSAAAGQKPAGMDLARRLAPPACVRVLDFTFDNLGAPKQQPVDRWLESRLPVRFFAYQLLGGASEPAINALGGEFMGQTQAMRDAVNDARIAESATLIRERLLDVVVLRGRLPQPTLYKSLAEFATGGGGLLVLAPPPEPGKAKDGSPDPAEADGIAALKALLPLGTDPAWDLAAEQPLSLGSAPWLTGVPAPLLKHGAAKIPAYALQPGDQALLTAPDGKPVVVLCRRGEARVLYNPLGLFPAQSALADEAWLAFWDRALRVLGGKPADDLVSVTVPARVNGAAVSVEVTASAAVAGELALISADGTKLFAQALSAATSARVEVPLARDWKAGECGVRFTPASDYAPRVPVSMATFTLERTIGVTVALDQKGLGVAPGAAFRIKGVVENTGPAALPPVTVTLVLRDIDGLALRTETKEAGPLGAGAKTDYSFELTMPDEGVQGWCYWAVVRANAGAAGAAVAETVVERWAKWSPRDEIQWAPWEHTVGRGPVTLTSYVFDLFADMGINGLGMRLDPGNLPHAWRRGWRGYHEHGNGGVDVQFDWPPDGGFDACPKMIAQARFPTAVYCLFSYGEEPGFGPAFGTTWHWGDGPAPDGASLWFRKFLQTQYPDIAALNAQWGSQYASFDEIRLERKYSEPFKHLDPTPADLPANLSPYVDTHAFYHWYVHQAYAAFERFTRAHNPTHASVMSMDNTFLTQMEFIGMYMHWLYPPAISTSYYAFLSQWALDDVAFVMNWGFMPNLDNVNQIYACSLVQGATAMAFWYDFPLQFNPDMTHTRAGIHMKALRESLRGREAGVLKPRLAKNPEVGVFIPERPWRAAMGREAWMMGLREEGERVPWAAGFGGFEQVVWTALQESGYNPRFVNQNTLAGCRLVVAPYVQCLDPEEADALAAFVAAGGTLVCTAKLATHDGHGKPYDVAPGAGTRELVGATFSHSFTGSYGRLFPASFEKDLPVEFPPRGGYFPGGEPIELQSFMHQTVTQLDDGTRVLARHRDGQPALLHRKHGSGNVFYYNSLYFHPEKWYTAWSQPKEAYRLLMRAFADAAGCAPPPYFLGRDPADCTVEVHDPLTLARHYTLTADGATPSHQIRLYRDWRAYANENDRLLLRLPAAEVVDLVSGESLPLLTDARSGQPYVPVAIAPAGWRILNILPEKRGRVELAPRQATVATGGRIVLDASITDAAGAPVKSAHALTLRAWRLEPKTGARLGPVRLYERDLVAGGSTTFDLPAHLEAATVEFVLTDASAARSATCRVTVGGPATDLPAIDRWETREPWHLAGMTDGEFLGLLRALTALYADEAATRFGLTAYLPAGALGRHAILERLARSDWRRHAAALEKAVSDGETFILLPEDLGTDPVTGQALTPGDQTGRAEVVAKLARKAQVADSADRRLTVLTLGKGRIVLARTSPDAAGFTDGHFALWHAGFLEELRAALPALADRR